MLTRPNIYRKFDRIEFERKLLFQALYDLALMSESGKFTEKELRDQARYVRGLYAELDLLLMRREIVNG